MFLISFEILVLNPSVRVESSTRQIACWIMLASCQRSAARAWFWSALMFCKRASIPVGLLDWLSSTSVVGLSSSPPSWSSCWCTIGSVESARFLWFQSTRFPLSCVSMCRYCSAVSLAFLTKPPISISPYLTQFEVSSRALKPSIVSCSKPVCLAITVSILFDASVAKALQSSILPFKSAAYS